VLVTWTSHPAKRRPDQVALVVAIVLLTMWVVLVTLQSILLAVLAAVFLALSIAPFLLPTRYRLDDAGVEQRRLTSRRFRAWSDLRRVQIGAGAALVSPFARPSWMDRHRGVMLYFDGLDADGKAQVVETLRARVGAAGTDRAGAAP
jgi:hypothetical protein